MTVALCSKCQRMISLSVIPGGNPVALGEPGSWATSSGSCPVCGRLYCQECLSSEPLCPDCPGPPQLPSLESMARRLSNMCRKRDQYTGGEFLNEAWWMSARQASVPERIQLLQENLDPAVMMVLHEIAAADYASRLEKEESPEFQAWIKEQEPEEINEEAAAWFAQWPSWEFIEALARIGEEERE